MVHYPLEASWDTEIANAIYKTAFSTVHKTRERPALLVGSWYALFSFLPCLGNSAIS